MRTKELEVYFNDYTIGAAIKRFLNKRFSKKSNKTKGKVLVAHRVGR